MNNSIDYKVLCPLPTGETVCFGLAGKFHLPGPSFSWPPAHPGPRILKTTAPHRRVSVLMEGGTLPHRPLDSPYVFRAMDTIFSSHVILVSLRMLYHTMPAGRTSSLRQKR